MRLLSLAGLIVGAVCVAAVATPAAAQKKSPPTTGKQPPAAARAAPGVPEGRLLDVLIRRTLLTLNDANLSGNYTVLRDLAAPGFRDANDSAKLGQIFAQLRRQQIDLGPIIRFVPKLTRQPAIGASGMLRVTGFIPTQPQQVHFDMLFQKIDGRWRVFGLAVNTVPVAAVGQVTGGTGQKSNKARSKK